MKCSESLIQSEEFPLAKGCREARRRMVQHPLIISEHARRRLRQRGIPMEDLQCVFEEGRSVLRGKVVIYALGKRETERAGLDRDRFEGLYVICKTNGVMLTAYRNRSLKGLRQKDPSR